MHHNLSVATHAIRCLLLSTMEYGKKQVLYLTDSVNQWPSRPFFYPLACICSTASIESSFSFGASNTCLLHQNAFKKVIYRSVLIRHENIWNIQASKMFLSLVDDGDWHQGWNVTAKLVLKTQYGKASCGSGGSSRVQALFLFLVLSPYTHRKNL